MKKGRTVLQAKRFGIHSCALGTSLVLAIRIMVDEEIGSLVVTDDQGLLAGVITRMDILAAHMQMDEWAYQPVSAHLRTDVPVVSPHTTLMDAARLMLASDARLVVVAITEEGSQRPVALLTDADLAYHLVKGA
jgi:CBS domain-containing protein